MRRFDRGIQQTCPGTAAIDRMTQRAVANIFQTHSARMPDAAGKTLVFAFPSKSPCHDIPSHFLTPLFKIQTFAGARGHFPSLGNHFLTLGNGKRIFGNVPYACRAPPRMSVMGIIPWIIWLANHPGRARYSVRAVACQPTRSAGRGLPALPVWHHCL
jgi:hypothetical protein